MRVLDYTTEKAPDLPNDWYALLNIPDEKDAEDEQKLTSAWIYAAIQYHPDTITKARKDGEHFRQQAVIRFQDIARAYNVLIDPVSRETYRQEREWYYQHRGNTPELRAIAKKQRCMEEKKTTTLDEHVIRHPIQIRNHYMKEVADLCVQWYLAHGRDGDKWGPLDDADWLAAAAFRRVSDGKNLVDGEAAKVLGRLLKWWAHRQCSFDPTDGRRNNGTKPAVAVSPPTSPVVPYRPRTQPKADAAKAQPKVTCKIPRKAPPMVLTKATAASPKVSKAEPEAPSTAEVKAEEKAERKAESQAKPQVVPKAEVSKAAPKTDPKVKLPPKPQPTAAPASVNKTLPELPKASESAPKATALCKPASYSNRNTQPGSRRRRDSVSGARRAPPPPSLLDTREDKLRALLDSFAAMEQDKTRPIIRRSMWHIIVDRPPIALHLNADYVRWIALANTKRTDATEVELQYYTLNILGHWHAYLSSAPIVNAREELPDWWIMSDDLEREAILKRIWFYALRSARRPSPLMGKYTHLLSALERDKLDKLAIVPKTLELKVSAFIEEEEEEEKVVMATEPEPAVAEVEDVKDFVEVEVAQEAPVVEDAVTPAEDKVVETVGANSPTPAPAPTSIPAASPTRSARKPPPPPLRATRSMLTKPAPASASHNVSKLRSFWTKLCCGVGDEFDDPPPTRTLKAITVQAVTTTTTISSPPKSAAVTRDTGDAADKLMALSDASADAAAPKTFTIQPHAWKNMSWAERFKARRFRAPKAVPTISAPSTTFSFPASWPVGSYSFSSADGPMLFSVMNDGKGKPATVTLAEPPEPVPTGLLNVGADKRAWRVEPGTREPDGMTASNTFYRWDNRVVAMHVALSDELYAMYDDGYAVRTGKAAAGDASPDVPAKADGTGDAASAGEKTNGGQSTNETTHHDEPTNVHSPGLKLHAPCPMKAPDVNLLNLQAQTFGNLQDNKSQHNLADAPLVRHPSKPRGVATTIVDDDDDDNDDNDPPVYDPRQFVPKASRRKSISGLRREFSCPPPAFISTINEVSSTIQEVPSIVISEATVEVERHDSTKVAVRQMDEPATPATPNTPATPTTPTTPNTPATPTTPTDRERYPKMVMGWGSPKSPTERPGNVPHIRPEQSTTASDKGKCRDTTPETEEEAPIDGDEEEEKTFVLDGFEYAAAGAAWWDPVPTKSDSVPVDPYGEMQFPGAGPSMCRAERQAGRGHWSESEFADKENQDEDDDRTSALRIGRPSGPTFDSRCRDDDDDEEGEGVDDEEVRNIMLRPSLDKEPTSPVEEEEVNDLVPPVLIVLTPTTDEENEEVAAVEETADDNASNIPEDTPAATCEETAASLTVPPAGEAITPKDTTASTTEDVEASATPEAEVTPDAAIATSIAEAEAEAAVEPTTAPTTAATTAVTTPATIVATTPDDSATTTTPKDTATTGTPESTSSSLPVASPDASTAAATAATSAVDPSSVVNAEDLASRLTMVPPEKSTTPDSEKSRNSVPSMEQRGSSDRESAELVTPSSSARNSPEPNDKKDTSSSAKVANEGRKRPPSPFKWFWRHWVAA